MATKRRPGGRSARVRAMVAAATVAELAERGYASFSCEAVAERAGVHKTTVYRRWGTRESLILDVMIQQAEDRMPVPDTGSLVDDLTAYGMGVLANTATPEVQATLRAIAASGDHNPEIADASRRFWSLRSTIAGEMVRRAVARGEVPPGTDPTLVFDALTGPLHFRLLISYQEIDEAVVRRVARLVAEGAKAGALT